MHVIQERLAASCRLVSQPGRKRVTFSSAVRAFVRPRVVAAHGLADEMSRLSIAPPRSVFALPCLQSLHHFANEGIVRAQQYQVEQPHPVIEVAGATVLRAIAEQRRTPSAWLPRRKIGGGQCCLKTSAVGARLKRSRPFSWSRGGSPPACLPSPPGQHSGAVAMQLDRIAQLAGARLVEQFRRPFELSRRAWRDGRASSTTRPASDGRRTLSPGLRRRGSRALAAHRHAVAPPALPDFCWRRPSRAASSTFFQSRRLGGSERVYWISALASNVHASSGGNGNCVAASKCS